MLVQLSTHLTISLAARLLNRLQILPQGIYRRTVNAPSTDISQSLQLSSHLCDHHLNHLQFLPIIREDNGWLACSPTTYPSM